MGEISLAVAKIVCYSREEQKAMNERERELLETELAWYINEQAIPQRSKASPDDLTIQDVRTELQAVQASLEGYAYGILRRWRRSQSQDDLVIDNSEEIVDTGTGTRSPS